MSKSPLTIEEVEKEFKEWRSNKNGAHPEIPKELCDQVKILLKSYRQSDVLRRLGITKQQLINKGLLPIKDKSNSEQSNAFIEIPITQAKAGTTTPGLILKRGDCELTLSCASDAQIQLIINTLLRL
jgi:hypothetical protein